MSLSAARSTLFVDLALGRRLERTEASANAAIVEARAVLEPDVGAAWSEIGGTCAMFDGPGSPLTQTFGLGMFEDASDTQLAALESFFESRGAPVFHEVCPLADASILALLTGRGYRPVELTSVLFLPLTEDTATTSPRITVRRIAEDEAETWSRTSAAGWQAPELQAFLVGLGRVVARAKGAHPFLAELDGRPVGTGAMHLEGGAALLAGASVLAAHRGQGGQGALLAARLAHARAAGCDLAMMCAAPGSASQRNAERNGFRIAYTRIKWGR